ncbi:MCE family protein [Pseudonocardia pini]|uniref:MCE family protein n=1 Tax=Pseudonocardia pini TaxID=2758030 RepID=UPI0015F07518|nr:MCE family protein [Pseudonocardia pini]
MSKLKFREKNPVTIALVGVGAILVIIFGSFQIAALPFIAGSRYEAVFSEAGGLNTGDKVKLAGTEAGQVTDVTLEDGDVVVTFTVKGVGLGDESVATIGTQTLLGERNLEVTSRGGGEMSAGDRIPLARTTAPYSITEGIEDVTRRTGEIDTRQVGDALDVFAETFKDTPDDLSAAFQGISRISETIASRDQALRDLLGKANDVSGILSERSAQLSTLLVDGNALLGELQSRREVIASLLRDTTRVTEQIIALNEEQRGRLQPALAELNHTIDILQRNEGNIGAAVERVSTFITGLGEGLQHGTSFTGYAELGGLGVFPTAQFVPSLTLPLPGGDR